MVGSRSGRPVARRTVLTGAVAALAGAAGLSACDSAADDLAPVQEGHLETPHWPGHRPRWLLALPEEAQATIIALHGAGGEARWWFDPPLAQAVAQTLGVAIVAVDGATTYWHARADGTDTGTMVVEDLLPAVESAGAPIERVGFTGFSMGGYGALLLATRLPPERVLGVAAVSAALFFSFQEASPGAFDDAADYDRHDVFARVDALRELPVWLACGAGDSFLEPNRALAAELPEAVTEFDQGRHDRSYLERHWLAGLSSLTSRARLSLPGD